MSLYKLLFFLFCIFITVCDCINASIKITGKVQNGLDGTAIHRAKVTLNGTGISTLTDKKGVFSLTILSESDLKIVVTEINFNQYLKKDAGAQKIILTVEKEQFAQLTYCVQDKINDLILGILPKPGVFKPEYYSYDHMSSTYLMKNDVVWGNIIDGVRLFHEKQLKALKPQRERYWNRDLSTEEAYNTSIESNRKNFRSILGAIDEREPVSMTKVNKVAETGKYIVNEVYWTVLKEIAPRPALQDWPELDVPKKILGEGLLVEPKRISKGFVIAIPDADQEPETLIGIKEGIDRHSQFARHLAENGYTVVIPVVIDRSNRWSRGTNRTSRSWIYAQAHEMGRTVTGYEIQKMEALIDWLNQQRNKDQKIGIAGYGEGGLLAFYTAALDTRVDAAMVSGYFAPREEIWKEPIYRNIWGLLKEFGDAEIASLIAPRSLVIEYSDVPFYNGDRNSGKKIDPPGELWTHTFKEVESEFNRISSLTGTNIGKRRLLKKGSGQTLPFGSQEAINTLMYLMGNENPNPLSHEIPNDLRINFDFSARMGRMVEQMVGHTQLLLRDSEYVRKEFVESWKNNDPEQLRTFFKEEMVGWTYQDFVPINPRTRQIEDQLEYVCYEVLIDVLPDIEMWGVLTVPKGIKEGEKRPVIVMQHGRGGNPFTALDEESSYYGVARRLAENGFVVFTPFGNWTGENRFRWIDRVAKPGKNSLWSTVGRQHQQLLRWFQTLPFIDPDRIAIYGKSIGGQAASLIASMLPEYALSINCAYFNESARKETSVYFPTSFVFHVDSEMPMWDRGHRLEYAEMANMLIFPRPFMVEHGEKDSIAPLGWVEYEYSKIHKFYNQQGKGEFTTIDLHEGGHIINGIKTIPFLQKHLNWSE